MVENGSAPFSVVDEETGRKRQAFADDLTDTQMKFIFHAEQERERMKKEKARSETSSNF